MDLKAKLFNGTQPVTRDVWFMMSVGMIVLAAVTVVTIYILLGPPLLH